MMIISKFKERPKLKDTWRAMVIGLLSLLSYPLLLIFFIIGRPLGEVIMKKIGVVIIFFVPIAAVVAIVYGIIAYIKGERSWVLWAGFIPAIIVAVVSATYFIVNVIRDMSVFF